jgi:hypothetical protein
MAEVDPAEVAENMRVIFLGWASSLVVKLHEELAGGEPQHANKLLFKPPGWLNPMAPFKVKLWALGAFRWSLEIILKRVGTEKWVHAAGLPGHY